MTRPAPLAVMALLFLWMAANISTTMMWVITLIAVCCLVSLIIFMRFKSMFVGPSTLVDDARMIGRRISRDEGGEADKVEVQRKLYEINDPSDLDVDDSDYVVSDRPRPTEPTS